MFFDEVNDWGIACLERAIEGLKCETAVHICYGYGIKANTDWKKTLGTEWYSPESVAEHAVGLMMSLNRRFHKAYQRTRDANFSLEGLVGSWSS